MLKVCIKVKNRKFSSSTVFFRFKPPCTSSLPSSQYRSTSGAPASSCATLSPFFSAFSFWLSRDTLHLCLPGFHCNASNSRDFPGQHAGTSGTYRPSTCSRPWYPCSSWCVVGLEGGTRPCCTCVWKIERSVRGKFHHQRQRSDDSGVCACFPPTS